MKILPDRLRWYAAFHDEGHHPHVHMMVWSTDPKQGFLTKAGIKAIRSKLTNDIFQGELQELYQQKDLSYREVATAAQDAMGTLISQMNSSLCDSPVIETRMAELAKQLETTTGKKQYGYLKKPLKQLVDDIVDELAAQPEVARCYEEWNRLRDELENYYKVIPRVRQPLSQQKEFRAIKNLVIREAENIRLGVPTFEDERMEDEPDEEPTAPSIQSRPAYEQAQTYRKAKAILADDWSSEEEQQAALAGLEDLYGQGYTVAAHQLGKAYRDGLGTIPDESKAEKWFRLSAEAGNDYSEYALGKLLLNQKRIPEALDWLDKAADHGNQFAQYTLGKLYLLGDEVPKDVDRALGYSRSIPSISFRLLSGLRPRLSRHISVVRTVPSPSTWKAPPSSTKPSVR